MGTFETPTRPYESISVDILDLPEENKETKVIVMIDRLTRKIHTKDTNRTPTLEEIHDLANKACYPSTPNRILTDSGPRFHNTKWNTLWG
jgi:hypothetical protein